MLSAKQLSAFVVGLASLQTTLAAPAPEARAASEFRPGPGLPSLESLGWNLTYINSLPDPVLHQAGMGVPQQRTIIYPSNPS
jgi:hypothetical protein